MCTWRLGNNPLESVLSFHFHMGSGSRTRVIRLDCWVASDFAREPSHPLLVQYFNETLINKKLGLWCSICGSSQTLPSLPPSYPRHLKTNFTNFKTGCDCAAVGNRAVRRKSTHTHLKNTYTRHPGLFFVWSERHISLSRFWASSCTAHVMGCREEMARVTSKTLQPGRVEGTAQPTQTL